MCILSQKATGSANVNITIPLVAACASACVVIFSGLNQCGKFAGQGSSRFWGTLAFTASVFSYNRQAVANICITMISKLVFVAFLFALLSGCVDRVSAVYAYPRNSCSTVKCTVCNTCSNGICKVRFFLNPCTFHFAPIEPYFTLKTRHCLLIRLGNVTKASNLMGIICISIVKQDPSVMT
jgi:hypothetical protein